MRDKKYRIQDCVGARRACELGEKVKKDGSRRRKALYLYLNTLMISPAVP